MVPVRISPHGHPTWLQGYADFTNRLKTWRDNYNNNHVNDFIHVWHHRDKKKPGEDDDVAQSSRQDEEAEQREYEELVLPTPRMVADDAARQPIGYSYPSSSTMHVSTAPEQTRRGNHLDIPTFPRAIHDSQTTNTALPKSTYTASDPQALPPSNIYDATGHPYDFASGDTYPNLYNTNPGTYLSGQTANTAPPEGICSPGYPSTFARQNIYSSAGKPYDFLPPNQYSSFATPSPGTYTRAQNMNTVASNCVRSEGCAPALASSSIYNAPTEPHHSANPNPYADPQEYNAPIPTASDFNDIPTLNNSIAMALRSLFTQPGTTCETWDDDFGLQQPDVPTVWQQNLPTVAPQSTQSIATALDFDDIPPLPNSVAIAPPNLRTQPGNTYETRDEDFELQQPDVPTVWQQIPTSVASQSTQPIAAASVLPVLSQESEPIAMSNPAYDPFMGAEGDLDMADDWP